MILVTIFDSKAGTWTPPKCCDSKLAAIREFAMLVNDRQQTLISMHPADFDLFQTGEWLFVPGGEKPKFQSMDFVHLANGIDCIVKKDEK